MKFIGKLIYLLTIILCVPFIILGYVASWMFTISYFGWNKAEKHQDYCIALSDKRKDNEKE